MLANWKDRIEGIKRIVLALGVISLRIVMSLCFEAQKARANPNT